MIKAFIPRVLFFCSLVCSVIAHAEPVILHASFEGVGDGDTIYVRDTSAQASYRVRLAMIDAPEKDQEYGQESKASLTQLLRGAGMLELDVYAKDQYGRLVAIVKDERGRNLNLQQVTQGAAWVYTQYASAPAYAGMLSEFDNAERNAKIRRMGLWASPTPLEPWKFRRQ